MKLGHRAARIPELLAAGATVGLGTDSVMTNNNLDPFEEMRQAGLLARFTTGDPAVLPCAEILELATVGGARVLGLGDEVGSIEVGQACRPGCGGAGPAPRLAGAERRRRRQRHRAAGVVLRRAPTCASPSSTARSCSTTGGW